ncbi:putative invertase inhibitor [Phtheirospermum japonicum]|uniref:Putative invertase inhibitor n=1 Tax=Phtheirospermum japonicum TaxID=374723 RepID=A0A830C1M7_9LAMI|nr:putative invertase inhibitor [Phtheirospermum japonicum]
MNLFSSCIPLSIFIPFILTIHAATAQNLIISTCKTSSQVDPNIDYTFCTTSLQSTPAASQCTTLQGLGAISITLIRHNLTDTCSYIKRLMRYNGKWNPYSKQCLSDCFDLFSDATDYIEDAMNYYDTEKFDDANERITSVMDGVTTCEDGFKERRGVVSPLSKRNDDVFRLSAVALSVMRMVQTGSG